MKITFYGTAAGEAWPGLFCDCPVCAEALKRGGKNLRTRSQALVNDDLLLDLPPDTLYHRYQYGLDVSAVKSLLFTHSHSDHCYAKDLENLREPYSHTRKPLDVFGNDWVEALVKRDAGEPSPESRFTFTRIRPGDRFETAGYKVLALRAAHHYPEDCVYYRIEKDGKSLLYAHDTGTVSDENLEMLREAGGVLSLVSLDCTKQQYRDQYGNHMGLPNNVEQKEKLLRAGLADGNTIFVVNHFSHNGGLLHEELCEAAGKCGFIASYDGMSLEF